MFGIRYAKASPTTYLIQYRNGQPVREGAGWCRERGLELLCSGLEKQPCTARRSTLASNTRYRMNPSVSPAAKPHPGGGHAGSAFRVGPQFVVMSGSGEATDSVTAGVSMRTTIIAQMHVQKQEMQGLRTLQRDASGGCIAPNSGARFNSRRLLGAFRPLAAIAFFATACPLPVHAGAVDDPATQQNVVGPDKGSTIGFIAAQMSSVVGEIFSGRDEEGQRGRAETYLRAEVDGCTFRAETLSAAYNHIPSEGFFAPTKVGDLKDGKKDIVIVALADVERVLEWEPHMSPTQMSFVARNGEPLLLKNGQRVSEISVPSHSERVTKAFNHLRRLCGAPEPLDFG